MSQTLSPATPPAAPPVGPAALRLSRPRRVLRLVSVVACVPYLALKAAWIGGSHVGIPDGSPLLEHRATMIVANGVTVLMDAGVIVLALLLTLPWGLRAPAWLLAAPLWVATGLLTPIMAGYPLQLAVSALGGDTGGPSGNSGDEPFLDGWVFGVVYTGFIVQGVALGSLFALHARDRWGHVWRGRNGDGPPSGGDRWTRTAAVVAAPLALFPACLHALWAAGSTVGLGEGRVQGRTADFHVLEFLDVLYLVAAVGGALVLVFRRLPALPVKVPLALAWAGSGATGCWGAWLLAASLTGPADDLATGPSGPTVLAYAVQMITGLLVAAAGARHLTRRAESTA
ncbi:MULTISPECIES: hypothetical protein [unclassified Streptomyces]|uniref:hypothetical protein n=1 Tax=unclassified Streptomyces TaxID=2593676 RepID=UPI0019294DDD|nr:MULTISPECIES: hypothetical protein [unclassified Streptomyces]